MVSYRAMTTAMAALTVIGISVATTTQAIAASASATTNATVVAAIAIANTLTLEFGNLAPGAALSVIRVSTAGVRTLQSGDATLVGSGTVRAASFDVTGDAGVSYDITLPASITLTSGGNTMTVDTFADSLAGTGTLPGGAETFTVGADLHVGIAQAAGAYTGSFNATVNYQ